MAPLDLTRWAQVLKEEMRVMKAALEEERVRAETERARAEQERARAEKERARARAGDGSDSDGADGDRNESWLFDGVKGALGPRGIAADLESMSGRSTGNKSHRSRKSRSRRKEVHRMLEAAVNTTGYSPRMRGLAKSFRAKLWCGCMATTWWCVAS